MKTLEILVLCCLAAEAVLFAVIVISSRKFMRQMKSTETVKSFKSNIFIESALSLDL